MSTLDTLWTRLWSGGPAERDVTLEIERDGTRQNVGLRSVDRAQTIKRPAASDAGQRRSSRPTAHAAAGVG